jgi:hypothetical protein
MVLNSNGSRYGFSQFWLNTSISRAYSQDVLDYHNVSRFMLRASRISDQASYMTYSHVKLSKRYDKNVMKVYYYDSRLYEEYFYKVLSARTKEYLRRKFGKTKESFTSKLYFSRSLIIINAKNISENLNKRVLSYYSALRNYNFSDISQNLTSLFLPVSDDFMSSSVDLEALDDSLNKYVLKQYILNKINKLVNPSQIKVNELLGELDSRVGVLYSKYFNTGFNRVANYYHQKLIRNNYFYIFRLRDIRKSIVVLKLLKKGKKLELFIPTVSESENFLRFEYYYYIRNMFGLKPYRKISFKGRGRRKSRKINLAKLRFGTLTRTYCTYKKEDENVNIKSKTVNNNKGAPRFSNPNYKGKNFDPNYHLLSRAEKQALKEKKQRAYEYAVAKAEGRAVKPDASRRVNSFPLKRTFDNVSKYKFENLKTNKPKSNVNVKKVSRPSATYNSPFMAEYRISKELLEESFVEYKPVKANIREKRRQQAYRDREKVERSKLKKENKFVARKESKFKQNLGLESDLDINYDREFYEDEYEDDDVDTIKKDNNESTEISVESTVDLTDFYEMNFENFADERTINETAAYLEIKVDKNKILKKGSSRFKTFSTYVKGDEFTLLEQEESSFKFPLNDLSYYTSIKKLKDDVKNIFIRASDFVTDAADNNGSLIKSKDGFQRILFSKDIQKSKLGRNKIESRHKNRLSLPVENFSFLDALRENFYDDLEKVNFYFNHKILQGYYNELMLKGARSEFITHDYLIDYLRNYYNEISSFIPVKKIEASNEFTVLSGGPVANFEDFKVRLSKHFFNVLNEPMLKYLDYYFSKEIPKILTDKSISNLTYVPKLLEYGNFNAILYARFVARRLKQRFNINETMKVLRNFLRSGYISGYLFVCSGRFSKKQRASIFKYRDGSVPLATFQTPVQHAQDLVRLRYGTCCIKVWVAYTNNK